MKIYSESSVYYDVRMSLCSEPLHFVWPPFRLAAWYECLQLLFPQTGDVVTIPALTFS